MLAKSSNPKRSNPGHPAPPSSGSPGAPPPGGAIGLIYMSLQQQSMATAMGDTFLVGTIIILFVIPLVFLLSKQRVEAQRKIELDRYPSS